MSDALGWLGDSVSDTVAADWLNGLATVARVRMAFPGRCLLVLVVSLGVCGPLVAQSPDVVQVLGCGGSCGQVILTNVGKVGGGHEDPVLMSHLGVPRRLANGHWITHKTFEPGTFVFYDSAGQYLRPMGREGSGPGEFRETRALPGPLGQLWLIDGANQRTTVLGSNGDILSTFSYHGYLAYTAPIDSQRVAVLGSLFTPSGGTLQGRIHVLSSTGAILDSFAEIADNAVIADARRIYATPSGTLVASHQESYTVQEWTLDGELLRVLGRDLDWFRTGGEEWDRRAPHTPALLSTAVDSRGLLWAVLKRPGEPLSGRRMPRGFGSRVELSSGIVIEVVDLAEARVVATLDVGLPYIFPVVPFDGVFVSPAQDNEGYIRFDVWKATIQP